MWSRIHLVPLLLAEGDRDTYRRQQAALAREREIMKDVKGWEVRMVSLLLHTLSSGAPAQLSLTCQSAEVAEC